MKSAFVEKYLWSFPSVNVTKSAVSADLVTFTEEILNGKLHFLCSVRNLSNIYGKAFLAKYLLAFFVDVCHVRKYTSTRCSVKYIQLLTIITKSSILDVAATLEPPLNTTKSKKVLRYGKDKEIMRRERGKGESRRKEEERIDTNDTQDHFLD